MGSKIREMKTSKQGQSERSNRQQGWRQPSKDNLGERVQEEGRQRGGDLIITNTQTKVKLMAHASVKTQQTRQNNKIKYRNEVGPLPATNITSEHGFLRWGSFLCDRNDMLRFHSSAKKNTQKEFKAPMMSFSEAPAGS